MSQSCHLEPKEFCEVEHLSGDRYSVSPEEPEYLWLGVAISAPHTVHIKKQDIAINDTLPQIPYCVTYFLGYPDLNFMGKHKLNLHNMTTGKIYDGTANGEFGEDSDVIRVLFPGLGPESVKNEMAVGGWRSFDLTKFIQIPVETAQYTFWITLGSTESNKCTINVIVEE